MGTPPKTIHLRYYAVLREVCGGESETRKTMARTATDLYEELQRDYKIKLPKVKVKLAINDEFCDWNATLTDGDCVTFLPPVAGG